ncbi:protein MIZU-KUSSEI 1-like [Zingiber officinale]|uniref:protein MIZU-KUSSEI 1-like n=1 Tax=Zingiber officinale TaxID=94328 RepID=UPI001C4A9B6B|nr:protein MIZU-KUSSEI 1-like [Zingiber officinale]
MRTIMVRSPHESSSSSSSFSKRHFGQWMIGRASEDKKKKKEEGKVAAEEIVAFSTTCDDDDEADVAPPVKAGARKKRSSSSAVAAVAVRVSRFRTALATAVAGRNRPVGFGPRVTGTLFGCRRGHVHLAFQADPRACPAVLIELATPTSALVREMASGLVRIALECDRRGSAGASAKKLVEEPLWRAYCNGRKCGYAVRRECGPADWRVLRAVEPVSTGAGVLPAGGGGGGDAGETMYLRARFERVVGSRDSEAFYMMNPDVNNGGPELSIYLLRV